MVRQAAQDDEFLNDFTWQVFSSDKSIRFICIADDQANLLASQMKPHVKRRLTNKEVGDLLKSWTIQMVMFDKYAEITGSLDYYLIKFHNLLGAAIPLIRRKMGSRVVKGRMFLFMSFEAGTNAANIIEDRIIPMITEKLDYFI
jgi:hypothetical protein